MELITCAPGTVMHSFRGPNPAWFIRIAQAVESSGFGMTQWLLLSGLTTPLASQKTSKQKHRGVPALGTMISHLSLTWEEEVSSIFASE